MNQHLYYCFYCERIIAEDESFWIFAPHGDLVCEECNWIYGEKAECITA